MRKPKDVSGLYQNQSHTPNERRENASRAGKASAEARRKRKALKEMMLLALEMEEQNEGYRSMMKKAGWEDIDQQSVITQGLIQKAKTGDVQAYNAIRDIIGEKPAEHMELGGGMQNELCIKHISKSPEDVVFPSNESEVEA